MRIIGGAPMEMWRSDAPSVTTVSSAVNSSASTRARAASVKSSGTNVARFGFSSRCAIGEMIVKSGIGITGADGAGVKPGTAPSPGAGV
jgi:hypothetical protein